jgi:hypothetical protein
VADIQETETGLLVTIRQSKTDQEGQGVTIAIARGDIACPVKAMREWLDAAGIEAGHSRRNCLIDFVRMHPNIGCDLTLLGQLDHINGRCVSAPAARTLLPAPEWLAADKTAKTNFGGIFRVAPL